MDGKLTARLCKDTGAAGMFAQHHLARLLLDRDRAESLPPIG
ncbi:hypothetical protein AB0D57_02870 [Streptomyces sp. NPDC048275]